MDGRYGTPLVDCIRCRRVRNSSSSNEYWRISVLIDKRQVHVERHVEVWDVSRVAAALQREFSKRVDLPIVGLPRDDEYLPSPDEIKKAAARIRRSWPAGRLNPRPRVELKTIASPPRSSKRRSE